MTLKILCNSLTPLATTNLELKVINNFIRKDLDIFNWMNWAYGRFGDFQFYSDYKLELNCFDQGLSLLIGREIQYGEDSLESYATNKCTEYLFEHYKDTNTEKSNVEALALKLTNYLVDASFICLHAETTKKKACLDDLFKKYFPEFEPMVWDSIIQKYSSNNA
jgi:hypothetical protein